MQMPQSYVIHIMGKALPSDTGKGSHIELSHPVSLMHYPSRRKEVPRHDKRDLSPSLYLQLLPYNPGLCTDLGIVLSDSGEEPLLPGGKILPLLPKAHIPIPKVGNGAAECLGFPRSIPKNEHLLLKGIRKSPHHVYIQHPKKIPGGVQKRRGIVIPPHHHHVTAGGGRHPTEKAVVELPGPIAGGSRIKNVSGDNQKLWRGLFDMGSKPVQKFFVLLVALFLVEPPAEMPIRGMDKFHTSSFCLVLSCYLPRKEAGSVKKPLDFMLFFICI
jgi:hypothetical protein